MPTYSETLNKYLADPAKREVELAEAAGCKQATINRYRKGKRFPDAEQARKIDAATAGEVPFGLWQSEFLNRAGLTQDAA